MDKSIDASNNPGFQASEDYKRYVWVQVGTMRLVYPDLKIDWEDVADIMIKTGCKITEVSSYKHLLE